MAFVFFELLRFRRKTTIQNLMLAFPEKSHAELLRIARGSYKNLGRSLFEYCYLPFMTKDWVNRNFEIIGLQNYTEVASQGRGVLLLTLHLGNGDLGLAGLATAGFPVNLISKHFKSEWLNRLWFGLREKRGMKFISEEKSSFQILRTLKANGLVVFVLDQFMGPPAGVRSTFFGHTTGTASGLALFSIKSGVPVLPGYTFRKPNGKMTIVFEPAIKFDTSGELDKDIETLTQIFNDKLESIVRKYPDQWFWLHRRWKTFEVR